MRGGTVSDPTTGTTARAVPPAGDHGDDVLRVARSLGVTPSDVLDLAAPRNPLAPDPLVLARRHLGAVKHYPDEEGAHASVAEALGTDAERLVVTNGASEAIALVAAEHPVGWVEQPEFSLYASHLDRVEPGGPRWASNPHNPLGRLAADGERAFVWDEAFYPLATGTWTRGDDAAYSIGSLTKVFSCPGLRMGYVVCPDDAAAAAVRARRPQWSVGGLAAATLPRMLEGADLPGWRDGIAALRRDLVSLLEGHGFEPLASVAPWVLVPGAAGLRERLAVHLVLVRDCASFGLDGFVRVAVPDEEGLTRLGWALDAID